MRGKRRPKRFRLADEVRKLARQRVGKVPASKVIHPKSRRAKPKHPKAEEEAWLQE